MSLRTVVVIALFPTLSLIGCKADYKTPFAASPGVPFASPLATIALPHAGRAMHEGSWARDNGNADARTIKPGETRTIFDYAGPGIVHRFWVTLAPRADMKIHRQAVIRMYWDGEDSPSVEAPIGDFFGVGFGEQRDYISLPLNETSGGYNCYWPMPFHKSARWTITNYSDKNLDAFYYNIDFTALDSLPRNVRHFHAQWRRENPTTPGKNYTILETTGAGHYAGVALFMQAIQPKGLGCLEGDEQITIDDHSYCSPDVDAKNHQKPEQHYFANPTTRPQIIGTGTEDYFSSGWYFDRGPYSAPYHGLIIKDDPPGRISTYRWHIEDAMPFTKSIKVTIEHGHSRVPNDHQADYSSIAFYYQNEPHTPAPPIKDGSGLLPTPIPVVRHFPNVIEAESLAQKAQASSGHVDTQNMGMFTGEYSGEAQLFWTDPKPGATLTLPLNVPKDGEYKITAWFTKAPDYATIQPMINDQPLRAPLDLYNASVTPSGPVGFGRASLKAGPNQLVLKITGKSAQSSNYYVGIDAIRLEPMKPRTTTTSP